MKTKYLALIVCMFCIFCTSLYAQKTVLIKQGEIIGSLPYGVHFNLRGSAALPNGEIADSVVVRIYDTKNKYRKKRTDKNQLVADQEDKSVYIKPENLIKKSIWVRYKDKDSESYEVYINRPLAFGREYLVTVNLYRRFNFIFSEEDQQSILKRVRENTASVFKDSGTLTTEDAGDYLNSAIYTAMRQKVELSGQTFYGLSNEKQGTTWLMDKPRLYLATKNYLENINSLAAQKEILQSAKDNLAKANADLADPDSSERQIKSATRRQESSQKKVDETSKRIDNLNGLVSANLQIINNQLVLVSVERTAGSVRPLAVTEIDAIKVGTSIGGGGIFFNPQDSELRDVNALAYTALKFYFFPVDKRVVEPYLTKNPLSRASFLFGIVTSNSFEYRGQILDKPIGLAPLAGISYDINRYFSLDVAATVFRQPSASTLIDRKKTRFAPVIGVTFDFDALNRIKTLTNNQGPYNLLPSGN